KPERAIFEKEVLWPAAGLDPARYDEFYGVEDMIKELDFAVNEAARRLINGEIAAPAAAAWLQKYALLDEKRADLRVRFIQRYRSYVINYNVGEDMVQKYIEKRGGTDKQPAERWQIFAELLSSPRLPGALLKD